MPTLISVSRIPGGEPGSMATLQKMRAVVNVSLLDPLVIETARRVVRDLPPRDTDAHAAAIRAYLAEHLQFVQDPRGVEMLATPRYLLTEISRRYIVQGDCDDAAVLGCALAKAVGLQCRLVVLAFTYADAPFSHVFGIVRGRTGWHDLDTTRSARRLVESSVTRSYSLEV